MAIFIYFVYIFSGPCVSKQKTDCREIDQILYYSSVVNGWISFALDRSTDILNNSKYIELREIEDPDISKIYKRFTTCLRILKGELTLYNPDSFPKEKLLAFNNSKTFLIDLYNLLEIYKKSLFRIKEVLFKFNKFDIGNIYRCGNSDLEYWTLNVKSLTHKCIKEIENLEIYLFNFKEEMLLKLGVEKQKYKRISIS